MKFNKTTATENEKNESKSDISSEISEIFEKKNKKTIIYVRSIKYLAVSLVNYFSVAVALFLIGYKIINPKIITKTESDYYNLSILISGITQYVIGLYDWNRGDSLNCIIEFFFGLNFAFYWRKQNFESPLTSQNFEGTFYVIVFFIVFIIMISTGKNKGAYHTFCYLCISLSLIFLFAKKFIKADEHWTINFFGYFCYFNAGVFWADGFFLFIKECLRTRRLNQAIKN